MALKVLEDCESSNDSDEEEKRRVIKEQPSMIASACQGAERKGSTD